MNTGFQFQPQDPDRSTRVPSDSQEFTSKSLRDLHAEISNLRLARIMLVVLSSATTLTMLAGTFRRHLDDGTLRWINIIAGGIIAVIGLWQLSLSLRGWLH